MGFTPSRALFLVLFLLFLLFLLPLLTLFTCLPELTSPKMAWQAEWKLLSAKKKLNKRGFINAQVLATLFTLINPEPRYSFWLAYTSFDHLIIFQWKTCNEIFDCDGTVLEWWAFLCILRTGLVLGKKSGDRCWSYLWSLKPSLVL